MWEAKSWEGPFAIVKTEFAGDSRGGQKEELERSGATDRAAFRNVVSQGKGTPERTTPFSRETDMGGRGVVLKTSTAWEDFEGRDHSFQERLPTR